MSDVTDHASDTEELMREHALRNHKSFVGESADECIDCGVLIPSARQIALPGIDTCVDCASINEKQKRF